MLRPAGAHGFHDCRSCLVRSKSPVLLGFHADQRESALGITVQPPSIFFRQWGCTQAGTTCGEIVLASRWALVFRNALLVGVDLEDDIFSRQSVRTFRDQSVLFSGNGWLRLVSRRNCALRNWAVVGDADQCIEVIDAHSHTFHRLNAYVSCHFIFRANICSVNGWYGAYGSSSVYTTCSSPGTRSGPL